MYIYKPNYILGTMVCLRDYLFGHCVLDLQNKLVKLGKKIKEVQIGRGGNIEGEYCSIACKWLKGEIMYNISEGEDMQILVEWSQILV